MIDDNSNENIFFITIRKKVWLVLKSDIAILNINGAEYHCIISGISKNTAIKLLKNTILSEKC